MPTWLAKLLFVLPAAAPGDDPVPRTSASYVASRTVSLTAASDGQPIDDIEVWLARDAEPDWKAVEAKREGDRGVLFKVPADGRYRVFLILKNRAGASSDPPTASTRAHTELVVDTTAPTLQIHDVFAVGGPASRIGTVRLSAVEENQAQGGLRVFYRPVGSDQEWTDGGSLQQGGQMWTWSIPASASGRLSLRFVMTDRAGNRARADWNALDVSAVVPAVASTTPSTKTDDWPDLYVESTTGDGSPRPPTAVDVTNAASDPLAAGVVSVEALRQRAREHLASNEVPLALARLADAIELEPENPELLVDLGEALFKAGRHEDATKQFEAVLARNPRHERALEQLALTLATRRQFPEARERLLVLIQIQPENADHWLHYGDVEYRLGNAAVALRAWRRVLDVPGTAIIRQQAQRRLRHFSHPAAMAAGSGG